MSLTVAMTAAPVPGLVLAAGRGSRYGGPKALARTATGEAWATRAVRTLRNAGAAPVTVVLGAAPDAAELLPDDVRTVLAEEWQDGLGESLRAGLLALAAHPGEAVLVTLVDLPGLPVDAVRRILDAGAGAGPDILRQAVYAGRPGHPVLIGRNHWDRLIEQLSGDHGARQYLVREGVEEIECGDLWSGEDVDVPLP